MTGYARVRREVTGGELVLSIKSVNHRGLDIHFHSSVELEQFEPALRSAIKKLAARGHLDVRTLYSRSGGAQLLEVNQALLEAYVSAFRAAAARFNLPGEPDLNAAFRLPGILSDTTREVPAELQDALASMAEDAVHALNSFREREGAELAALVRARCGAIREQVQRMEQIRDRALPTFRARLSERLADLLAGAAVDPQRLAQEAALMADRSDIQEELARLGIHAGQFERLLAAGGEIGKKADFLLQEMNREANTILSKTSGIGEIGLGITELALECKADIEKMREQALNLE
jgi:uncharacterized protein (TIGR00255 family)